MATGRSLRLWCLAAALALAGGPAGAADRLILQLRDASPDRAAGFLAARDRGDYAAEALDVTILPPGPADQPLQALATGRAEVAIEQMPTALVARGLGLPVVNLAQIGGPVPLTLVCPARAGVRDPAVDLAGKTVAVAPQLDRYGVIAWLNGLGVPSQGGPAGVTLIQQGDEMAILFGKRASCAVRQGGQPAFPPEASLVQFDGGGLPGDGLYALQTTLEDPAARDRIVRFLRASIKGWAEVEQATAKGGQASGTGDGARGALGAGIRPLDAAAAEGAMSALTNGPDPVLAGRPADGWASDILNTATAADQSAR